MELLRKHVKILKDNVVACTELSNAKYPMGLSEEEVYVAIHQRTEQSRAMIIENHGIIKQYVKPLLDDPQKIDEQIYEDLFRVAQEFAEYENYLDIGLAYDIYSALVAYAELQKDDDKIICCKYWKALSLYYLHKNLYKKKILDTFSSVINDYKDGYFALQEPITRQYFNRCFGNVYLALLIHRTQDDYDIAPYLAQCEAARIHWSDEKVRALDPQLNFDNYLINIRLNNIACTDYMRHRVDRKLSLDREFVKTLYVDACFMKEYYEKMENTETNLAYYRVITALITLPYHLGEITLHEMAEQLYALYKTAKNDVYDGANNHKKSFVGPLYCYYLEREEACTEQEIERITKEIPQDILAYCDGFPLHNSPLQTDMLIDTAIAAFAQKKVKAEDGNEPLRIVLEMTIFRHMPTYVHSVMVSKIGKAIASALLERRPKVFVGMPQFEAVEDVLTKKEWILSMVEQSGMTHDIGKIIYLQTLSNYARALNDEEFGVIRLHPEYAADLFVEDENFAFCREVALGHHKWYDGTKGYPMNFDNTASPYRVLIDIISIADSIDAATDTTGRGYAKGCTLEEVIAELFDQAGTRYAPDIVEIFRSDVLVDEIRDILSVQRKKAYYKAYVDYADKNMATT